MMAPTVTHFVCSLPPEGAAFSLGAARRENHPPACPLRVAAFPLAGGNTSGPAEPVPRCSTRGLPRRGGRCFQLPIEASRSRGYSLRHCEFPVSGGRNCEWTMNYGFVTAGAARQSMHSERHGLLHFVRNDNLSSSRDNGSLSSSRGRQATAIHAARSHGLLHFVRNDGKVACDDGLMSSFRVPVRGPVGL